MGIGRPSSTTGPPITIYHPVFSDFVGLISSEDKELSPRDVKAARQLMDAGAQFFESEAKRFRVIQPYLNVLLGDHLTGAPGPYQCHPDGVLFIAQGNSDLLVPVLVFELKNEMGAGGSDATTQGSFSWRKLWAEDDSVRFACIP